MLVTELLSDSGSSSVGTQGARGDKTYTTRALAAMRAHQLDERHQRDEAVAGGEAIFTVLAPGGVRVDARPPVWQCVRCRCSNVVRDGAKSEVTHAAA